MKCKIERYENIISAIANIDTLFIMPDGDDREFDDKEALEEIFKLVKPVWEEICERKNRETKELFKEWGIRLGQN